MISYTYLAQHRIRAPVEPAAADLRDRAGMPDDAGLRRCSTPRRSRRRSPPSSPRIGASRSTLSTPFCNVITRVSGRPADASARPAVSVSHSLTANSTTSTGPTVFGSSVTFGISSSAGRRACSRPSGRCADGVAMRAARDERDVVTGRRQPRAEIAADGARRHDRDAHMSPPQGGLVQPRSCGASAIRDPRRPTSVTRCSSGTRGRS